MDVDNKKRKKYIEGLRVDFKKGARVEYYPDAPDLKKNDVEIEAIFQHYINSQEEQFTNYLNYMHAVLCELKRFGIVSDYTRFMARIKGLDSALTNDSSKPLNDVFGLEVDTATEGEAIIVNELFSAGLHRTRDVVYNKTNGYIAHHYSGFPEKNNDGIVERTKLLFSENRPSSQEMFEEYKKNLLLRDKEKLTPTEEKRVIRYIKKYKKELEVFMKNVKRTVKGEKLEEMLENLTKIEEDYKKTLGNDDEIQPIIECQIKTIAVAISANLGSANHGEYKGDLIEQIQKEYEEEGIKEIRNKLPYRMFRADLEKDKQGKPKPLKILSAAEMLKALYPSIILSEKDEMQIER